MKLLVIGGHSRDVGKTSVAAGLIAATRNLRWTALKVTQYGHGVCSTSGSDCHCAVEDPEHPFAIDRELDLESNSDTARLLQAGAREVYWVRTRVGDLSLVLPALEKLLADREYVLMESNSILRFCKPDLYLPVLRYDVGDFKLSSRLYLSRADAFVVSCSQAKAPGWKGVDARVFEDKPVFAVQPPQYVTPEMAQFVRERLSRTVRPAAPLSRANFQVPGRAALL